MKNFFESPLKFAEHLVQAVAQEELALHEGLKKALRMVRNKARGKIGHYQAEAGPFNEWPELADSTKQDRVNQGYPADKPLLREGTLRDSIVDEVAIIEGVVGSKDPIAAYQEYGTDRIPARPFIGPAAYESKEKIKAIIGIAAFSGLRAGKGRSITEGYIAEQLVGYDFNTEE